MAGRSYGYPWMIRDNYFGCAACHVDPSGFGLLTQYGRAQGELLLRTHYSSPPAGQEREPGPAANFLWGALDWAHLPDWLLLKGSYRGAYIGTHIPCPPPPPPPGVPAKCGWDVSYTQMQLDFYAGLHVGHFVADGNIGALPSGALPARVTTLGSWNLISREHWIGYEFAPDNAFLLRAGRINLPFGLRNVEHTSWVRFRTRTDVNSYQQHGVAFAYTGDKWRGELMGILGNFQISPPFRERGYSGYAELSLTRKAAIGISSLVTHANKDVELKIADTRQAHGVFARYAPIHALVFLAEGDFLAHSPSGSASYIGYAGFLQGDLELIQGVHLFQTVEIWQERTDGAGPSYSFWLTPNWFFAPHADIRLDLILQRFVELRTSTTYLSFVAMLHVYL